MSHRHTLMGLVDTGRISVPTVMDSLLGRLTAEACDKRLAWWSRKLIRDADIDLEVRGREHAEGSEPFVVMSNHQSLYDIPALFCALPGRIRMVAKSELFKVPIWGKAMLAAGFIRIDRSDHDRAVASLRAANRRLKDGTRVWIAPEGTRSATGELGAFKGGGFRLALETGVRILPVAIDGTRRVLPARGSRVELGQHVIVTILPPVDPAAYGAERRKELMEDVRRSIERALSHSATEPSRQGDTTSA